MTRIFLIISTLVLLLPNFFACKNEEVSTKSSNTTKNAKGDIIQKLNSAAFLTTGFWKVDAYIETAESSDVSGLYYKFYDDGTFDYHKNQEILSKGIWKFDWRAQMIDLTYEKLPKIPLQWEVLTFNSVMVWKGNTPKNPKGIQVKFTNYPTTDFSAHQH
jgi:hypothetical protein